MSKALQPQQQQEAEQKKQEAEEQEQDTQQYQPAEKTCRCTGIRTCLICDPEKQRTTVPSYKVVLHVCPQCLQLFRNAAPEDTDPTSHTVKSCADHNSGKEFLVPAADFIAANPRLKFEGLVVVPNFIKFNGSSNNEQPGESEEQMLIRSLTPFWTPSQSGRCKIDLGPRANFKERKVKHRPGFDSFPLFLKSVVGRISELVSSHPLLASTHECTVAAKFGTNTGGIQLPKDADEVTKHEYQNCGCFAVSNSDSQQPCCRPYQIAELSALDYDHKVCANLDFHLDDPWLWGGRIAGLCLVSDTVMSFSQPEYASDVILRAFLPRGALFVLSGTSRYHWRHGIFARDLKERRVSITMRELTKSFVKEQPELAAEFVAIGGRFA